MYNCGAVPPAWQLWVTSAGFSHYSLLLLLPLLVKEANTGADLHQPFTITGPAFRIPVKLYDGQFLTRYVCKTPLLVLLNV
jgi:hypothetical protein